MGIGDYDKISKFFGEATKLAISRYEYSLIQMNLEVGSKGIEERKEKVFEQSKVFIHGAYEILEKNSVQNVYNITLSFDNLLGRLENKVEIRVVVDREDDQTIDSIVNSNLEAVRVVFNNFNREGLEVSEKVFFSEEKEKSGIFIRYNPKSKMN